MYNIINMALCAFVASKVICGALFLTIPLSFRNYSLVNGLQWENRFLVLPFNLLLCFAYRCFDHHVKIFKMPRLMLECLGLMMLTSLRNPTQTLNKLGFIFAKYPDTYYNSKDFPRISWINQYLRKEGTGKRTISWKFPLPSGP